MHLPSEAQQVKPLTGAKLQAALLVPGLVLTRERCCLQVGWFPEYTITEDYALSQELKMAGFRGRYLPEYLAVSVLAGSPHSGAVERLQLY